MTIMWRRNLDLKSSFRQKKNPVCDPSKHFEPFLKVLPEERKAKGERVNRCLMKTFFPFWAYFSIPQASLIWIHFFPKPSPIVTERWELRKKAKVSDISWGREIEAGHICNSSLVLRNVARAKAKISDLVADAAPVSCFNESFRMSRAGL